MILMFLLGSMVTAVAAVSLTVLRFPAGRLRWPALCLLVVVAGVWCSNVSTWADEADAPGTTDDVRPRFERPQGWPAEFPLPTENTNCVRCHLHAGRELTGAVRDLCRSTHDMMGLSCADCHGGNTEDDVTAHNEEFGFIGTKLSSHIETCSGCHDEQASLLSEGGHAWDWSERINLNYPMCVDCHGNHDIGNPPESFALADVCFDCHDAFDEDYPAYAALVDQNDKFWQTLMQVRQKNLLEEEPVPDEFVPEIDALREQSMQMFHAMQGVTEDSVKEHNQKLEQLRMRLADWLQAGNQ